MAQANQVYRQVEVGEIPLIQLDAILIDAGQNNAQDNEDESPREFEDSEPRQVSLASLASIDVRKCRR